MNLTSSASLALSPVDSMLVPVEVLILLPFLLFPPLPPPTWAGWLVDVAMACAGLLVGARLDVLALDTVNCAAPEEATPDEGWSGLEAETSD